MFALKAKNVYLFLFIACAVLSLITYARAFNNPFRQDDFVYLDRVETVRLPDGLKPSSQLAFYRPGMLALFYIEHMLFARNGGAYIAFNYFLHLLIALLMLLVLDQLGLNANAALLASGMFLLGFGHYGKQVMWACSCGALAAVLLSTAAILAALRWTRAASRQDGIALKSDRFLYPATVVALLALSPLFHETSIIVSLVIVLILAVAPSRATRRPACIIPVLIPFALWLSLCSACHRVYLTHVHIGQAALVAPLYVIRYAGFMIVPLQKSNLITSWPALLRLVGAAHVLHIVAGAAIVAICIWLALRATMGPRILGLWFLCALLPFSFLPRPGDWLELRYLYHASIPFCGLAATAVVALASKRHLAYKFLAGAVVIGATAGSAILVLLLEESYS